MPWYYFLLMHMLSILQSSSSNVGTIVSTIALAILLIVCIAVPTTIIMKAKVKVQMEMVIRERRNVPNYEGILDTGGNIAYGTQRHVVL